jgi:uncharacterized protein (DUF983 family)
MNDMSGFRKFQPQRPNRPLGEAIKRGLRGLCPSCGRGGLFRAYLKLAPNCTICGEDLSHARADDAPAYLTMLVVAHFVAGGALYTEENWPNAPLFWTAVIWLAVTVVVSLLILPRMKGAVVGQQWALYMHGFGKDWRL